MKYSVVLALFLGQISCIKIESRLLASKDHHKDDKSDEQIQLLAHALKDDDDDKDD